MGMELLCKLGRPLRGMGSIDSPTDTQEDCVESDLGTLSSLRSSLCRCCEASSWAPGLVPSHCLAGVVLLLTSSLRLILWSAQCEEGVGGLFGLAGQGVTNIASGQLEVC
eukprot:1161540-Pelagomonas_calceolata.AAC.2